MYLYDNKIVLDSQQKQCYSIYVNVIHEYNRTEVKRVTNSEALKQAIKDAGVSIVFLAEKMDCSRNRIYAILGGSDCNASEIAKLSKLLHMTNEQRDYIFLSESVN